jgi:murein DD-endopeptidase MepM/ murein hydrolase activator NlpD
MSQGPRWRPSSWWPRVREVLRRERFLVAGTAALLAGAVLTVWVGPPAAPRHLGAVHRTLAGDGLSAPVPPSAPSPRQATHGAPAASPPAPPPATSATPAPGPWRWPVVGHLAEGYGWVDMPWLGEWVYHTGWDIAAPVGSPVRAVAGGTVVGVQDDPLLGWEVQEAVAGGYVVTYAGLADVEVVQGESVGAGEVLARLGQPGPLEAGEGPHLHFAVSDRGAAEDPGGVLPPAP